MTRYEVTRYDCLEVLAPLVGDALVVIPPGGIENEWFALRPGPANLRLAMGEVTPLCLGLALALPRRRVVAIDADGSVLINLGAICTVGLLKPPNLKVVVIDNECYESIGGIPSHTAMGTDLAAIARGSGIAGAVTTRTLEEFRQAAAEAFSRDGLAFIVAKVAPGAKDLPAVYMDGLEMKYRFVRHIEETEGVRVIEAPRQQMPKHLLTR